MLSNTSSHGTPSSSSITCTTSASVSGGTLSGVISGDTVTLGTTTASFDDKNVGTGKPVSVTGIAISGTDSGNYTFNAMANTIANVTTRPLTIAAAGINKIYDGNTAATVTLCDNRVSGDVFTASYTNASFNDSSVGTGKPVSVVGISISGTDAGNYSFNTTANTIANITSATVDHIAITPVYSTIALGASQAYTAISYDQFNNAIANVTVSTTFTVTNGTCQDNICTPVAAGIQTVTGSYGSFTATATLPVTTSVGMAALTGTAAVTGASEITILLMNSGSGPAENVSGTINLRRLSGTGPTTLSVPFNVTMLSREESIPLPLTLSFAPDAGSRYAVTETGNYTDPNASPSAKTFSLSQAVVF